MRALGLDLGTKTIGLAVTDELFITAQGLPTHRRAGHRKDLEVLIALAKEMNVDRFIIGLPLNMDGSAGTRAEMTRKFGSSLEETSSIPVIYWDERLTTVAAHSALHEGDVSARKRKEVIDQVAAVLILQGWMASQRPQKSGFADEEDS